MTQFILDTDIFSYWAKGTEPAASAVERHDPDQLGVTVVTVGEVIHGWHVKAFNCKREKVVPLYEAMLKAIEFFRDSAVLEFRPSAYAGYERLLDLHPGSDKRDLWNAAIVLDYGFVLVTNNTGDYENIQGLRLANWHRP